MIQLKEEEISQMLDFMNLRITQMEQQQSFLITNTRSKDLYESPKHSAISTPERFTSFKKSP